MMHAEAWRSVLTSLGDFGEVPVLIMAQVPLAKAVG